MVKLALPTTKNRRIADVTPRFMMNCLVVAFLVLTSCIGSQVSSLASVEANHGVIVEEKPGNYEKVLSGRAEEANGKPYSFSIYKSSDAESVSTRTYSGSIVSLQKRYRHATRHSSNLSAEIGHESNAKLKERAVVFENGNESESVCIWLMFEKNIIVIDADNISRALDFEEWLFERYSF